jgi:iron complex transport system substrate-binding protein
MNQKKKTILLLMITIIAILGVVGLYINNNRSDFTPKTQITDMSGRSVAVPAQVNRVVSITFSVTVPTYMLAPDKLIAWNSNLTAEQKHYIPAKYRDLPVVGGGKEDANYETFLTLYPDVVLAGHAVSDGSLNGIQQKFGKIPVVDVEGDNNITNIVPSIKFLGDLLGEQGNANKLIDFYNNQSKQVNSTVAQIPEGEKKKVYYARDPTGLQTGPSGSSHTQLIEMCGGVNVAEVPLTKGSAQVSIEQILQWNPDVIIAKDPQFYQKVYTDPVWQNLNAVKNRQVYLVPNYPFNWFEGPPGANSIIGIPWTAKVLYPDRFKDMDIKNLTKEFYSNFYHYNLTDQEVSDLLTSSGLKEF